MTQSDKGKFLMGILIGVTTGVLLAPRRSKGTTPTLGCCDASADGQVTGGNGATQGASISERSEALKRKIEETRERLRAQVGESRQP